LGSEQSSDPLQICACGRGQGAGASEWASKLGVPAVGSYRRPVPTGHGAARAGARGPSVSLRRTGAARTADKIFARCTLHVPSARRSRSLPPPPPPPPPGRRHRAAAVSCARTFARRAPSHSRRTAPVLMLGFGSELGVGFRAGGRAVKLGRKRRVSKREIETCRALSKRGRRRPRYIAR
jgi:hypothetical protein